MRPLEVPPKYQRLYEKAMSGKSRRAAMRCHCLMCVGWSASEVDLCTARTCPLYPYRLGRAELQADGTPEGGHGAARSHDEAPVGPQDARNV